MHASEISTELSLVNYGCIMSHIMKSSTAYSVNVDLVSALIISHNCCLWRGINSTTIKCQYCQKNNHHCLSVRAFSKKNALLACKLSTQSMLE